MSTDDLHQQLWELVYDLLPEDEASELLGRITSDADVARAYSKVKIQSEMVGRAAKLESAALTWQRPTDEAQQDSSEPSQPVPASRRSLKPIWRTVNWLISTAALLLVAVMSFGYWGANSPFRTVASRGEATPAVRAVVTGPEHPHLETTNTFLVNTTRLDDAVPHATSVNYRVVDNSGDVRLDKTESTDDFGVLEIKLDRKLLGEIAQLEITPENSEAIVRDLQPAGGKLMTYLRLDKPLYQPGETVLYRSVTLSRFSMRQEREIDVVYEVLDADGNAMSNGASAGKTLHGVGSGEYTLAADAKPGTYSVVARSPTDAFPVQWRDFTVDRYEVPKLQKQLELAQDSYTSGEEVKAELFAKRSSGDAAADVDVQYFLQLGDQQQTLPQPTPKTDAEGRNTISFQLPERIEANDARLMAIIQDGPLQESISKQIPINLGTVNVAFYPEGGDLVSRVPNRVYFHARDTVGKPISAEGVVLAADGREVAQVKSQHEGRGVFEITPEDGMTYSLRVDKPVGTTSPTPLPPVAPQQRYALSMPRSVVESSQPLDVRIYSPAPQAPVVVAAYCRGAQVGQARIEPNGFMSRGPGIMSADVTINLPPEAQGVIRVTAFDFGDSPPTAIAERLAYRRFDTKLDVKLTPQAEKFSAGDHVSMDVDIADEAGNATDAILGIAVVDDGLLNLAEDKSMRLPTYFQLLTEIERPQQLEDANFYLSQEEDATQALDLLLGTQGWRRFVDPRMVAWARNESRWGFTPASTRGRGPAAADDEQVPQLIALEELPPPVVEDNAARVKATRRTRLAAERRARRTSLHWYGTIGIGGGALVLLAVVVLAVTRASLGVRLALPTAAIAAVLMVVGARWSSARIDSQGKVVYADLTAIARTTAAPAASVTDSVTAEPPGALAGALDADMLPDGAPMQGLAPIRPKSIGMAAEAESPAEGAVISGLNRQLNRGDEPAAPAAPAPSVRMLQVQSPENLNLKAVELAEDTRRFRQDRFSMGRRAQKGKGLPTRRATTPAAAKPTAAKQAAVASPPFVFREYAYDVSALPENTLASGDTLFWSPLRETQNGKTAVRFQLPEGPATFRALIEAHGNDRVGSGEILIRSAE